MAPPLRIAQIVESTEAEGPGRRFALWLQGCPLRCAGCCNPEMLPFKGGAHQSVRELAGRIGGVQGLEGVTLMGGEPFAQADSAAVLCRQVRELGLSVMIFSGYTLEELQMSSEPGASALLGLCDILVDGRYERSQPDTVRRWIGSRNQRLHFLTDRYGPDDLRFQQSNTVEIRLKAGSIEVNGWPELAKSLLGG